MRPLGIPLCGRRMGQQVPGQPEQGILHLFGQKPMIPLFEFLSELPDLRAQPEGTSLTARAEEAAPIVGALEQLKQSSTSLHLSSRASLENRSRTSSMMSSGGLSKPPGSLATGGGGFFIPSCTRACPHAHPPGLAVSAGSMIA